MYDYRVNEVSLLFYGRPEGLNSALLLNLNIIEFREEAAELSGLYILENKFGKEILRKLSLDFGESGDWLVYRYLSAHESELLKSAGDERRIYVLLQNYMTLEYFQGQVSPNSSSHFFISGNTEVLKSITAVREKFKPRNLLIAKNVKKAAKSASENPGAAVPDFMAVILKLLLNPVDEMGRVSQNLMHSNRRILYRFAELAHFFHYVIYMSFVFVFKVFGVKLYWRSWSFAIDSGNFLVRVKVRILETVYYQAVHKAAHALWLHVLSPIYYKYIRSVFITVYSFIEKWVYYQGVHRLFYLGLSVLGKIWEKVVSPVYFATIHRIIYAVINILQWVFYKIFHRLFYRILKPAASYVFFNFIHRFYFRVVHRLFHDALRPFVTFIYFKTWHLLLHGVLIPVYTFLWYRVFLTYVYYGIFPWIKFNFYIRVYNFFVYRVWHYSLMVYFKIYGLCYDLVMLTARITKLYLMYPFFKVYWFTTFQYNKRIKKFFA